MKLLLDTHVAVWAVAEPELIAPKVRQLIERADLNYVSMASLWEIALKSSNHRASAIPVSVTRAVEEFRRANFRFLDISLAHIQSLEALQLDHADPFDRLILAQAISEPLRLITKDRKLAGYDSSVISW